MIPLQHWSIYFFLVLDWMKVATTNKYQATLWRRTITETLWAQIGQSSYVLEGVCKAVFLAKWKSPKSVMAEFEHLFEKDGKVGYYYKEFVLNQLEPSAEPFVWQVSQRINRNITSIDFQGSVNKKTINQRVTHIKPWI